MGSLPRGTVGLQVSLTEGQRLWDGGEKP